MIPHALTVSINNNFYEVLYLNRIFDGLAGIGSFMRFQASVMLACLQKYRVLVLWNVLYILHIAQVTYVSDSSGLTT